MRLIFIRHGDPDYSIDNLTEKGKREVALLTDRICTWQDITAFFTSSMGRAIATGQPALEKLGRTAHVCPWLREFTFPVKYPDDYPDKNLRGKESHPWDLLPQYFNSNPDFFDKDKWLQTDFMKSGKIKDHYQDVCSGIDNLLEHYGYVRNSSNFYDVKNPLPNHNWNEVLEKYHLKSIKDDYPKGDTLVFFCHLGVMFAIISHLIGLSPMQLWQGFFVAPTSVTILNSEERIKGQAWFRVERLGDTRHLTNGGENISSSGSFSPVFPG